MALQAVRCNTLDLLLQAQEFDAAGKKQEAEAAAKRARDLNIIGLIIGTISAVIFIIVIFAIILAVIV